MIAVRAAWTSVEQRGENVCCAALLTEPGTQGVPRMRPSASLSNERVFSPNHLYIHHRASRLYPRQLSSNVSVSQVLKPMRVRTIAAPAGNPHFPKELSVNTKLGNDTLRWRPREVFQKPLRFLDSRCYGAPQSSPRLASLDTGSSL